MSQKKQQKETQIAEKQTASLQTNSDLTFKGNEEADATDIIVPRMLLMQGTSKWVPDQFNQGDIINSVEETVLAKKGETVEIIPFMLKKSWEVFTRETPATWVRSDVWNAANDAEPWEFEETDPERGVVQLKRQRQYGFYAFVVTKEADPFPIPVLVNFRSSAGFKEGKKIASHFAMMKGMNQPGFNVVWSVSTETVKDGDKNFQKFVIKKSRNTTEDEAKPVVQWLTLMNTNTNIKDHTVDDNADVAGPVMPTTGGDTTTSQQAQF